MAMHNHGHCRSVSLIFLSNTVTVILLLCVSKVD